MTRGERIIAFIERFCRVPEGEHVGKQLVLDEFQREFILAVYDNPLGTHTGILSIGRKNGKTALIAGICLAHLVGPEAKRNTQLVSGAQSRDQAALVFKLMVKMIQLNPKLQTLIHIIPSSKTLHGLPMGTEYRALSAEGKTTHGLSPALAILDETGQVKGPQDDFVDAVITAQGAHRDPLLLVISTQAPTDADLLSVWIDDALTGRDPHTVCRVYAAPPTAEIMDESAWRAANPALGKFRSIDDVRKLAEKANRMPSFENSFRNLVLNQRVSTITPYVSRNVWQSCAGEHSGLAGLSVYGGLDLSSKQDLTALVLRGLDSNGLVRVVPYFWTPEIGLLDRAKRDRVPYDVWKKQGFLRTTPGATVDYEYVASDIAKITEGLTLKAMAFDRWSIQYFKKACDAVGVSFPLVEYGQGFKDMAPALDALDSGLLNGKLRHGAHPVLTMCAANAVVVSDPAGNRKLEKSKSTGRIDGLVALAMAEGVAMRDAPEIGGDFDDAIFQPLMARL